MSFLKQLLIFGVTVVVAVWYLDSKSRHDVEFLRGKRIVITGCTSGVGEQLAYHYSRMGCRLILSSKMSTGLSKVVDSCKQLGAQTVDVVVGDLTKVDNQIKLSKMVGDKFGNRLDQLLLSHGTFAVHKWGGSDADLSRLKQAMDVNLVSFVDILSRLLPALSEVAGGVGVVSGLHGILPVPFLADVSAAQAAQQRFFSSLRQELNENENNNVTVTTAVLGFINTEKTTAIYTKFFPLLNPFVSSTPEGAAEAIAKAVTDQKDHVIYPFRAQLQRYFYDLYQEVYEYNFHQISL